MAQPRAIFHIRDLISKHFGDFQNLPVQIRNLTSILLDGNVSSSVQKIPGKERSSFLWMLVNYNKVRKFFWRDLKEDLEFRLIF